MEGRRTSANHPALPTRLPNPTRPVGQAETAGAGGAGHGAGLRSDPTAARCCITHHGNPVHHHRRILASADARGEMTIDFISRVPLRAGAGELIPNGPTRHAHQRIVAAAAWSLPCESWGSSRRPLQREAVILLLLPARANCLATPILVSSSIHLATADATCPCSDCCRPQHGRDSRYVRHPARISS